MENRGKKHTIGRQKIEIKKIENTSSLQVTFSKRRTGLIKKAGELSVLCGADVAVIVKSPAKKVYAFGNPSADSIIHRFLAGNAPRRPHDDDHRRRVLLHRKKYMEAVGKLETEKEMEKAVEECGGGGGVGGFWWDEEAVDELGFDELQQYMASLEVLKKNVTARADEIAKASASPSNFLALGAMDYYNAFYFDRKLF